MTPNARRARVVRVAEASYEVKVDARAEGGRANRRLVELLSEHLQVPRSRIAIVTGARSREKLVEVLL